MQSSITAIGPEDLEDNKDTRDHKAEGTTSVVVLEIYLCRPWRLI
jgi:hypothetical protein